MPEVSIQFSPNYLKSQRIGVSDLRNELNRQLLTVLQSPDVVNGVTLTPDGMLKVSGLNIDNNKLYIRGRMIGLVSNMRDIARGLGGRLVS